MKTKLITGPTIEPVTLDDAKNHLRIDTTDEHTYIMDLVASARRLIELHSGRRFITQTWELALDKFPSGNAIALPYPPLQSVTSVTYYDTDDSDATFSSDDYYVDTYAEPGALALNYGESWPNTTLRPTNGIIVKYIVGYGDAETDVPEMYKQAIKILAAELYERREATDFRQFYELPWSVRQLIGYERIWHV